MRSMIHRFIDSFIDSDSLVHWFISSLNNSCAHWDLELAVEVRQCRLRSAARGWGPAARSEIWSAEIWPRGWGPAVSQLRSEIWSSLGPAVPTEIWSSPLGGRKERKDGRTEGGSNSNKLKHLGNNIIYTYHLDLSRLFWIAFCIHGSPTSLYDIPAMTPWPVVRLDAGYGTVEAPEAAGGKSKRGHHQSKGLGVWTCWASSGYRNNSWWWPQKMS